MLLPKYLKKVKNILKVKIKPKNDMMYQGIYNCICQNTKKLKYTIHYVMDFEAVERVQLGHSKEMNGWHQMLETGVRRKSYMPLWITNATELLSRIALSVNVSLPIWRSRRADIPSCPCWQIWLQGCDDLSRWHRYFCNVTHVSIQDKCSFNQTIWN